MAFDLKIVVFLIVFLMGCGVVVAQSVMVEGGPGSITLRSSMPTERVYVFVDDVLEGYFPVIDADGERLTVAPGDHTIEVRFARWFTYAWELGRVVVDDTPAMLRYVKYDHERDKIEFSLKGAAVVAPEKVNTTFIDQGTTITSYKVVENEYLPLTCSVKINTEKEEVYGQCHSKVYARSVNLTLGLGIRELTNVTVGEATEDVVPDVEEESALVRDDEKQEAIVVENITLRDTIHHEDNIPSLIFVVASAFLVAVVISVIAWLHKRESKRQGAYHPQKNKK